MFWIRAQVVGSLTGCPQHSQLFRQVIAGRRLARFVRDGHNRHQDALLLGHFEWLQRTQHAPFHDSFNGCRSHVMTLPHETAASQIIRPAAPRRRIARTGNRAAIDRRAEFDQPRRLPGDE